jgi:hypothetical protein
VEWTQRQAPALQGRLAALIVVIAALLFLAPINSFTNNYDEGVYWQSLRAMAAGHPLFTSVFSSQPPYFLLSIYPFYMAFGQSIAAARAGVAFFGLVGVVALYWLASELVDAWFGLLAAALLLTQPIYLQQAHTLESDGPAVAVSILAVAVAVGALRRVGTARRWLVALSGALLAYATLIKLSAVIAVVPIALYALAPVFQSFMAEGGIIRSPGAVELRRAARIAVVDVAWLAGGAAVATLALLAPFAGALPEMWRQSVAFHVTAQQSGLPASETNGIGLRAILAGNIPLELLTLVTVAAAIWRRAWWVAPPIAWLLAAIVALTPLNPYFAHYASLLTPGLALSVALAPGLLAPLLKRTRARWLALASGAAIAVLLATMLISGAQASLALARTTASNDALAQIAAINAFTEPGEVIVSDNQYVAAEADHSVPPELVDTSYVRIHTGSLTTAELEAVIERDHIRVVILATNRLATAPDFLPWLKDHFTLLAVSGKGGLNGDGFQVYVRGGSGEPGGATA